MESIIECVEDQNFIRVSKAGAFSVADQSGVFEDIVSQKYWRPGMPLLFDNRKVDFSRTDYSVVREASSNYQRFADRIGKSRAAILMKSISDFGLGRQFEMISENKGPAQIRVFLDEKEALDWLSEKSF